MTATCRSCGAPIEWAVMSDSGKRVPLDDALVEDGGLSVVAALNDGTAAVAPDPHGKRRSHFATCPQAKSWRRG
jgi:hypothetical protein